MEPITLCGAIIVVFGIWIEFELTIIKVIASFCKSQFFKRLRSVIQADELPVCANRYVTK